MKDYKQEYIKNIDSDYGFEVAKKLLEFKTIPQGFRLAGTPAEEAAGKWIASEMERIGLKNVTIEKLPVDAWEFKGAEVEISVPGEEAESFRAGSFTCLPGTDKDGISGELVYVGDGTKNNYEDIDVSGKIVLIDTNSYETYWYNVLFMQAEARGALAVVTTITGGPGSCNDDLITTHDVGGCVKIPAVMLTKGAGDYIRTLLKSGAQITATVKADITITPGAEAHYVYGMIPGKNPDRYVMVGGHYDAYWDGFLDNATSLGTSLTMAKAMIDIGYEPESTFIFVSNGAEEYGVADTCFGFATGSTAMLKAHPEWVEGAVIYNNYELTAICQTENFEVICSPSCKSVLNSVLEKINPPQGFKLTEILGVGADDAIFSKKGIPSYMNVCTYFTDDGTGRTIQAEEPVQSYDHTEYDNIDRYDPEVFDFNNKIHGLINMAFDSMPVVPLDFKSCMDSYMSTMDKDTLSGLYPRCEELFSSAELFGNKAAKVLEKAEETNNSECNTYDSWAECKKLLKVNKILQDNIYKFGPFSSIIIGHTQPLAYVNSINALITELEAGQAGEAIEGVIGLDNNYIICDFDKIVYEKVAIKAYEEAPEHVWGANETLPFPDMYDVLTSIMKKAETEESSFENEIEKLIEIRDSQLEVLINTLDTELEAINEMLLILDELLSVMVKVA